MDLNLAKNVLILLTIVTLSTTRRPPQPPPRHNILFRPGPGRGGIPIPIHSNEYSQRRIQHNIPPPKFRKPPIRHRPPPQHHNIQQFRPPAPFNTQLKPPTVPGPIFPPFPPPVQEAIKLRESGGDKIEQPTNTKTTFEFVPSTLTAAHHNVQQIPLQNSNKQNPAIIQLHLNSDNNGQSSVIQIHVSTTPAPPGNILKSEHWGASTLRTTNRNVSDKKSTSKENKSVEKKSKYEYKEKIVSEQLEKDEWRAPPQQKVEQRPDQKSDQRPDYYSQTRPEPTRNFRPESRPDYKEEVKMDYIPDFKVNNYHLDQRSEFRPEQSDFSPDFASEYKPDIRPDQRSDIHLNQRPDIHLDQRPDIRPDQRPDIRHDQRPDIRPDQRPDIRHDQRPDIRPDQRPDIRHDRRPDIHLDQRPDIHLDQRPDTRHEQRPDIRPDRRPDIRPDQRPDIRHDQRPDIRYDQRPDIHLDQRPDNRHDQRPDIRPDQRPDIRQDQRPVILHDQKPDIRPDHKVDNRPDTYSRPDHRPDYRHEQYQDRNRRPPNQIPNNYNPMQNYNPRQDLLSHQDSHISNYPLEPLKEFHPLYPHNNEPSAERHNSDSANHREEYPKPEYEEREYVNYKERTEQVDLDRSKEKRRDTDDYSDEKYSQPDPLYHPDGDIIKSAESRDSTEKLRRPIQEEVLKALGFEMSKPLEYLSKKNEALYSEDFQPPTSEEVGYPGTSYKVNEKAKRPYPDHIDKPLPKKTHYKGSIVDFKSDQIGEKFKIDKYRHKDDLLALGDTSEEYRVSAPSNYDRTQQYQGYYRHPGHYPVYVQEPEPIIEIIVQDSNITYPPPPKLPPTTPSPPPTPEPVHVFYVRYSSNNKSQQGYPQQQYQQPYGAESEQSIKLESPVQSIPLRSPTQTPLPHLSAPGQSFLSHYQPVHQETTTLRAVIRPDKNEYESKRLKVGFQHNSMDQVYQQSVQSFAAVNALPEQVHQGQNAQPTMNPFVQQQFWSGNLANHGPVQQQGLSQQPLFQGLNHEATQQPNFQNPTQQPQFQGSTQQPQFLISTQQPQFQGSTQQPQYQGSIQQPQFQSPIQQPNFQNQNPTQPPQFHTPTHLPHFQGPSPYPSHQRPTPHPNHQPQQGPSQFPLIHTTLPPLQLSTHSYSPTQSPPTHRPSHYSQSPQNAQQIPSLYPNFHQQIIQGQSQYFQHSTQQTPTPSPNSFAYNDYSQQNSYQQQQEHREQQQEHREQQQEHREQQQQHREQQQEHHQEHKKQHQEQGSSFEYQNPSNLNTQQHQQNQHEQHQDHQHPTFQQQYNQPYEDETQPAYSSLDPIYTARNPNLPSDTDFNMSPIWSQWSSTEEPPFDPTHAIQQFLNSQSGTNSNIPQPISKRLGNDNESKLPEGVPEELKQQLLSSGMLANADVQVINFDSNMFKELGDLPPETFSALQSQMENSTSWENLDERSKRSIIIVNEFAKHHSNNIVLVKNKISTFLFKPNDRLFYRIDGDREIVKRAVEYANHRVD